MHTFTKEQDLHNTTNTIKYFKNTKKTKTIHKQNFNDSYDLGFPTIRK